MIQKRWATKVSDKVETGRTKVDTITYEQLKKKYNLQFNTLVADCEGALYSILKDNPEILKDFQTIIIENDYVTPEMLHFVDNKFSEYGFKCVYRKNLQLPNPEKIFPHTHHRFYEVYKK